MTKEREILHRLRDRYWCKYPTFEIIKGRLVPDGGTVTEVDEDIKQATELIENLIGLVEHCQIHSGYKNCGYLQMTSDQKSLYDSIFSQLGDDTNDN